MAKNKYFGISAHAGMHPKFPVNRFLKQFPDDLNHAAITILSGSFGWSSKLIRQFASQYPNGLIEVYLGNGCARRSRPEKGDFAPEYSVKAYDQALISKDKSLIRKIERRLGKIYSNIFDLAPTCRHVLCPELEDNMSDEAAIAICKIIGRLRPDLELVRNPCTRGHGTVPRTYYELHGIHYNGAPGIILNMDGISLDAKDGSRFFQRASESTVKRMLDTSNALATFIWSARQQGYPNLSNWSQKPPKKSRTFEVSDQEITMIKQLLKGR